MEIINSVVDTVASADLPWEETTIMPIGDIQLGAQGVNLDKLKRHLDWGMMHGAYFIGMGDYVDVASPSNRAALRATRLYDSVQDMIEDGAARAVEDVLKVLSGTEDRWLGLLEGHHLYEFKDGTTSDTRIAQALRAPFLGTCAFIRLHFRRHNSDSRRVCTIWCHHGSGGGNKVASPLNKLENLLPYFDADIYLMGHMSKKVAAPIDQLYMSEGKNSKLRYRTKLLAGTGAWLQGYMQGSKDGNNPRGSYVEQAVMNPTALGGIIITVRPVHHQDTDRLDLNVSL
jgi:hypothetical protein